MTTDFWTAVARFGLVIALFGFALVAVGAVWVQIERWQDRREERRRRQ